MSAFSDGRSEDGAEPEGEAFDLVDVSCVPPCSAVVCTLRTLQGLKGQLVKYGQNLKVPKKMIGGCDISPDAAHYTVFGL